MKKMCCKAMRYHTSNHCIVHNSPFECPDRLVIYNEKDNDYGLIIHDGGESVVKIYYCPWCGSELSSENKAQNTITDCIGDCTGDGVPRP